MASRMLKKSWLIPIIVIITIVPLFGIFLGCPGPLLHQKAPNFTLPTLAGANITLSELIGTPVLLNFWATWCPPCREGLPHYDAVARKGEGKIKVIAINVGESASKVREFFGAHEPTMIVALDEDAKVFPIYNPPGWIPVTFFIDREGIIQYAKTGPFASEAELWRKLNEVLNITIPQTS